MADITKQQGEQIPATTQIRYKDMGDGTFALVIATTMLVDGELVDGDNPMPTVLYDSSGNALTIDSVTQTLTVMNYVHKEIHSGSAFSAGYVSPHASLVANDGVIEIIITTTTKINHMTAVASFGGDFEAYLYEAPTFSGGTPIAPRNHYRPLGAPGDAATTVTAVHTPTVTDAGTELEGQFLPGGTGGNSIGIVGTQRNEWDGAIGTSYLFRLINRAGTAQQGSLGVNWYEETP